MITKRAVALVLLVGATACSQGSHGTAVLKAEPTPVTTTLEPTQEPTPEPTQAPTHSPTPKPTLKAPTHAPVPKPTASPTPVDTRPTATVLIHNNASMSVKGVVGDYDYVLASGKSSARVTVHIDPGGNTGVGFQRADDPRCGGGSPNYLKAGHGYTLTLTDGGTCAPGKSAPTGHLTES